MNDYSYLRNEVSGDPAELEEFLADPYLVFSIDLMCKKKQYGFWLLSELSDGE